MTTPDTRVQRLCDVCFQVDDHPRHVTYVLDGGVPTAAELAAIDARTDIPASALREVLDPTTVVRHMDCCASRGCPTCAAQLKLVPRGAKGSKLLGHIQANGDEHREAVEKALGVYELNRAEDNDESQRLLDNATKEG